MEEASKQQQRSTLQMAVVTAFITTFMGSALNLSIPALETEFHTNAALVGWAMTAFTLAVAALSVPMGKIADATSRRKVLILGISAFAILSLLCIFAQNIGMLIALRGLQGMAASMIFATNNALLLSVYPGSKRGAVLGISTAATYIGLSLGPVLGGFLNHHFGWRSIFVATIGISLVALALAIKGAPASWEHQKFKVDGWGMVLYVTMVAAVLYGLTNLSISRYSWMILVAGALLGVAFVYVETRADNPVIRVTMFTHDAIFTLSNLAALLNYGATFAISYLGSIYLQVVMGYSSQKAGLILICMPAMQAIFSPMMGRLSDRIAPYKLASLGMGFCGAGILGFSFLSGSTPLWYMILFLLVEGFGFALFSSPNTNSIMGRVQARDYGVANSILATMRTTGQSGSMAVVTIVVGLTLGNKSLLASEPSQIIGTLSTCFHIFFVLCLVGVLFSLKRKEK